MVMKERETPQTDALCCCAALTMQPGEPVQRNTPAFLPPPMRPKEGVLHSDGLGSNGWWIAGHPLTARVAVNRFWQQFFGVGLVKTAEDFGAQGEWPSHPDLLDAFGPGISMATGMGRETAGSLRLCLSEDLSSEVPMLLPAEFATGSREPAAGPRSRGFGWMPK